MNALNQRISKHFLRSEFACRCGSQPGFQQTAGYQAALANYRARSGNGVAARWVPRAPCDGGFATVDTLLLETLERLRSHFAKPVVVNSACRCEAWNVAQGGAHNSQHLRGCAADIKVVGVDADEVAQWLMDEFPQRYGIGRYRTFTHFDTRSHEAARWDNR